MAAWYGDIFAFIGRGLASPGALSYSFPLVCIPEALGLSHGCCGWVGIPVFANLRFTFSFTVLAQYRLGMSLLCCRAEEEGHTSMEVLDRAASRTELLFFFYSVNNRWSRICINLIRKSASFINLVIN